jgi:hypothetical protein
LRGEIWVPPTAARREATRVVKVKMDFMEIFWGAFWEGSMEVLKKKDKKGGKVAGF